MNDLQIIVNNSSTAKKEQPGSWYCSVVDIIRNNKQPTRQIKKPSPNEEKIRSLTRKVYSKLRLALANQPEHIVHNLMKIVDDKIMLQRAIDSSLYIDVSSDSDSPIPVYTWSTTPTGFVSDTVSLQNHTSIETTGASNSNFSPIDLADFDSDASKKTDSERYVHIPFLQSPSESEEHRPSLGTVSPPPETVLPRGLDVPEIIDVESINNDEITQLPTNKESSFNSHTFIESFLKNNPDFPWVSLLVTPLSTVGSPSLPTAENLIPSSESLNLVETNSNFLSVDLPEIPRTSDIALHQISNIELDAGFPALLGASYEKTLVEAHSNTNFLTGSPPAASHTEKAVLECDDRIPQLSILSTESVASIQNPIFSETSSNLNVIEMTELGCKVETPFLSTFTAAETLISSGDILSTAPGDVAPLEKIAAPIIKISRITPSVCKTLFPSIRANFLCGLDNQNAKPVPTSPPSSANSFGKTSVKKTKHVSKKRRLNPIHCDECTPSMVESSPNFHSQPLIEKLLSSYDDDEKLNRNACKVNLIDLFPDSTYMTCPETSENVGLGKIEIATPSREKIFLSEPNKVPMLVDKKTPKKVSKARKRLSVSASPKTDICNASENVGLPIKNETAITQSREKISLSEPKKMSSAANMETPKKLKAESGLKVSASPKADHKTCTNSAQISLSKPRKMSTATIKVAPKKLKAESGLKVSVSPKTDTKSSTNSQVVKSQQPKTSSKFSEIARPKENRVSKPFSSPEISTLPFLATLSNALRGYKVPKIGSKIKSVVGKDTVSHPSKISETVTTSTAGLKETIEQQIDQKTQNPATPVPQGEITELLQAKPSHQCTDGGLRGTEHQSQSTTTITSSPCKTLEYVEPKENDVATASAKRIGDLREAYSSTVADATNVSDSKPTTSFKVPISTSKPCTAIIETTDLPISMTTTEGSSSNANHATFTRNSQNVTEACSSSELGNFCDCSSLILYGYHTSTSCTASNHASKPCTATTDSVGPLLNVAISPSKLSGVSCPPTTSSAYRSEPFTASRETVDPSLTSATSAGSSLSDASKISSNSTIHCDLSPNDDANRLQSNETFHEPSTGKPCTSVAPPPNAMTDTLKPFDEARSCSPTVKQDDSPILNLAGSGATTESSVNLTKTTESSLSAISASAPATADSSEKPAKVRLEFVSTDPAENADNFNPRWEELKNISSDAERYRKVRERWRNLGIPDPNRDLSHMRRRDPKQKRPSTMQVSAARGHKRTRSCTDVFERLLQKCRAENRQHLIELDHEEQMKVSSILDQPLTRYNSDDELLGATPHQMRYEMWRWNQVPNFNFAEGNFGNFHPEPQFVRKEQELAHINNEYSRRRQILHAEMQNTLRRYRCYISEVKAFQSFYQGLNSADDVTLLTPHQNELLEDTERMYAAFGKFYK